MYGFDPGQIDVAQYLRLFADRREHIGFMRWRALISEMENRIFATGERGQVNGRAGHLQTTVMAGEFAERSFFLLFIGPEKTLEDELGVRRHLQRDGLTGYDLEGFGANRARHRQPVDAERKRTGSPHNQRPIQP